MDWKKPLSGARALADQAAAAAQERTAVVLERNWPAVERAFTQGLAVPAATAINDDELMGRLLPLVYAALPLLVRTTVKEGEFVSFCLQNRHRLCPPTPSPGEPKELGAPRPASDPACPFCSPAPDRIAFERPLVLALWDAFPVSPGHLLVVPRRHVATWFDAMAEEHEAIRQALDEARQLIAGRLAPDGYNIGVNVGRAAGQTVFHLHIHLIPRYSGDVPDPRGGVRHVIPGKGNYLT